MATIEDKKKRVLDVNTKLAFACIDAAVPNNIQEARKKFVADLESRCNNPTYIAQGDSSLCGPAAFLYCVAREKPDDFANYVLDLALTGKGHLGGLEVAPGEECRNLDSLTVGTRTTAPVDWVALASLRDSGNSFVSMKSVDSDLGGITFPSTLAGWFEKTGWFSDVRNEASKTGLYDPLYHLLSINALPLSYICLFINAKIMKNEWMGPIPNHWVVLGDGAGTGGGSNGNDGSVIRIATPGTKILDSRGRAIMTTPKMETPFQHNITQRVSCLPDSPACVANNDPRAARRAELEQGKLTFNVYT